MIKIVKGDEPEELKRLRETAENQGLDPKEAYELLNADRRLKKKIKRVLVKEQGGLCAYCMCRIPRDDVEVGIAPITIEHYIPRNPEDGRDIGQGLDYNNLLTVCNGNRAAKGTRNENDLICDAHRKNTEFIKVNPCVPETLNTIFYYLDGKIDATDADVKKDLTETLNLNCTTAPLIKERKAVLDELMDEPSVLELDELVMYCDKILENLKNEQDVKTPYVGILLWYLKSIVEYN